MTILILTPALPPRDLNMMLMLMMLMIMIIMMSVIMRWLRCWWPGTLYSYTSFTSSRLISSGRIQYPDEENSLLLKAKHPHARCCTAPDKRKKEICMKRARTAMPAQEFLLCLHFSCAMCPFLAVVLVNSAPQLGHEDLLATPDFSRWWRRRFEKVLNWRPLHPWSQHWGLGRDCTTRTWSRGSRGDCEGWEIKERGESGECEWGCGA